MNQIKQIKGMKHIKQQIGSSLMMVMLIGIMVLNGCKNNDPQPETEHVKAQLIANTWKIQNVTVDDTDQSALFTGLTLSFTESSYATTNGGAVWPASGTWMFSDDTAKKIQRSDGLEITVVEVSATNLKLGLTRTSGTIGLGRIESVAGNHVFSFVK